MNGSQSELVQYRTSRSKETYSEACLLADEEHWNAVANRLYYACFYMVNALLINDNLSFSSHNGIKAGFHKNYIKTERISMKSGKTYSRLFNLRQEADYADFKRFTKEDISPFLQDVSIFLSEVEKLIIG